MAKTDMAFLKTGLLFLLGKAHIREGFSKFNFVLKDLSRSNIRNLFSNVM